MQAYKIRLAIPEDVEAIRDAHRKSIVEIAAKDYPKEVIAEWGTNRSPESISKQKDAIKDGEEITWVAEINNEVIGFAVLVPKAEELRAIYVTGKASQIGVGTSLLKALEEKQKFFSLRS